MSSSRVIIHLSSSHFEHFSYNHQLDTKNTTHFDVVIFSSSVFFKCPPILYNNERKEKEEKNINNVGKKFSLSLLSFSRKCAVDSVIGHIHFFMQPDASWITLFSLAEFTEKEKKQESNTTRIIHKYTRHVPI